MTDSDTQSPSPVLEKPPPLVEGPTAPPRFERVSSQRRLENMNGPLYMQTSGNKNVVLVRRVRRKDDGIGMQFARWMVENQIGLSFNLLALLFLTHFFIPKARPHTVKFFTLSYYHPDTGKYAVGADDAYLIASCVLLFTALRAATMEYILAPIAKMNGLHKRKDLTRFIEQAWLLIYYAFFFPAGIYLYCVSPYYLNMKGLWTGWPDRELAGLMKAYIVGQWSFWLQQILVIHIEDRRKDHVQMLSHHIITTALLSACYFYHFTRVGHIFLVIMDVVDPLLSGAKCLKYLGYSTVCDIMFGVFMLSWLLARHLAYNMVVWSIHVDGPIVGSCYTGSNKNLAGPTPPPSGYGYLLEPFYNPQGTICWSPAVKWGFLGLLIMLQIITVVWFFMIIRVAIRVIRGGGADDVRSDDEEEEEEEEEDEFIYEEAQPLEEEVGVDELDLKNWERRSGVKRQSSASGVSLPGHSDRKELLNRIGCEKQVN